MLEHHSIVFDVTENDLMDLCQLFRAACARARP
jgi:hypothetical protein